MMNTQGVSDTDSEVASEHTDKKAGPGQRLKAARLQQHMSLEDVAKQLHLHVKVIDALEADRYEGIAVPTFVRGYLRSYSRILNLPPEEIIAAYDQCAGEVSPPVVTQLNQAKRVTEFEKPTPLQMAGPRVMIVAGGVVGLLLLSYIIWQVAGPFDSSPAKSPQENELLFEEMPLDLNLSPPSGVGADSEATKKSAETPAAAASVTAPAVSPPPAVPARPSEATISMSFTEAVWVEVSDANGERLIYSLGTRGESKTAKGVPPFKVNISRTPGVQVFYNGKPYDYSAHIERGVAKFTLGQAERP